MSHWHNQKIYTHVAFKLKLEEIVGNLSSTLTRKYKHLVSAYSHREITTGWWNLTTLVDLMDTKAGTEMLNTEYNACVNLLSVSFWL